MAQSSPSAIRVVWILVGLSLSVALLVTLWFVIATIHVRVPYWGEAEVLFEASRLRTELPLYVDPVLGSHAYGDLPSRYYVTYPPLWTWVVSRVSDAHALMFARLACTFAWFGTLATIAARARPEVRREAIAACAFVAGIWVLANFAMVGRPDSIACAIAAFALTRSIHKGEVDDLSVALFVLVPWVKPTIIGLPLAAIVGGVVTVRARKWRTMRTAMVLTLASFVIAHFASDGALLTNIVKSNAQPFTVDAWIDQVPARLPFFAPLFAWASYAAWRGWRDDRDPGMKIGLFAIAGAVAWTLFALAKTGSSSNYWMEPCIASVVVLARSRPTTSLRVFGGSLTCALVALVAVLWADVGSIRAALEHTKSETRDAAFVATIRRRCDAMLPIDAIAADEAGIELELNGRILTPTYQMVHLVQHKMYPVSVWVSDLEADDTRCLVEHTGQMRLVPELAHTIDDRFVLVADEEGFRVWKKRVPR